MRNFSPRSLMLQQDYWTGADGRSLSFDNATAAMFGKLTTALAVDGVGDLKPPSPSGLFVVTPDEAGDGIGVPPGNPTIVVGDPATIGSIGTIGDQDFYAVHLDAGILYQIGLYGHTGGPG